MILVLLLLSPSAAIADYEVQYFNALPVTGINSVQGTYVEFTVTGATGDTVRAQVRECASSCSAFTPWESATLLAQVPPASVSEAMLNVSKTVTINVDSEAEAVDACTAQLSDADAGTGNCDWTFREMQVSESKGNVTK